MPVNPNKRKCQRPGCNAWAMRGQGEETPPSHCRSHRDHELGARNAGAPKGNINALKSGDYSQPLSRDELELLAHTLVAERERLPQNITEIAESMFDRAGGDPFLTILLLGRLIMSLPVYVADNMFVSEMDYWALRLPEKDRIRFRIRILEETMKLPYYARLIYLRKYVEKNLPKSITGKTIDRKSNADL